MIAYVHETQGAEPLGHMSENLLRCMARSRAADMPLDARLPFTPGVRSIARSMFQNDDRSA